MLQAWVDDLKKLETGPVRYCVLDIMGDWPAFLQVFGLRYWSHKHHPCPLCRVNQEKLCQPNISDWTLDSSPFTGYGTNDYLTDLGNFVKVPLQQTAQKISFGYPLSRMHHPLNPGLLLERERDR